MRPLAILATATLCALSARASWYWPFESGDEPDRPRLSELMEPATTNIDAAADFAAEGKIKEAQECYRAAIAALKKIEAENPERAATPEFATVRNKRAYINAALDAMLLAEARDNAKAVSVTDTRELEVKLVLKPWKELQPTYVALTNVDRLVVKRQELVSSRWVRDLLDTVTDPGLRADCASNCAEIVVASARYAEQKEILAKAYAAAAQAVSRLERFSETASAAGGARVYDVCRKDARKSIEACRKAWPKCGVTLDRLNANLEGVRNALCEAGAKRDFPEIARAYAERMTGRTLSDAEELVEKLGYRRACEAMLEELAAAGAGVVHHGVLYRVEAAWGGEEAVVPEHDDGRGLVKDDSDTRPEVENQIDSFMAVERKHNEKVKKVASAAKTKKGVRREIETLLNEDPQSRRARLLMAGECLRDGAVADARAKVDELLANAPDDLAALNLRAAIEATEGDLKAAERTLQRVIQTSPEDYHAYYNMANLCLQRGDVAAARHYYEMGRSFAGPENAEMEKAVMFK